MCLSAVTKKLDGTVTMVESGWKYFRGSNNTLLFPHCSWSGSMRCPEDQWITASDEGDLGGYASGFHIFTDEEKVKKRFSPDIRRVYFRRVVARGIDQTFNAIVAKEMYVPSRQDDWPPFEKKKKAV